MSGVEQDADVKFLGLKCGIKWFFGRRVAMPGDSLSAVVQKPKCCKFIVVGGVEEASCLSILGSSASQPIPELTVADVMCSC